ncbi:class I SAM-dependent methyltransferase [Pelagibacteraceae bacterium]|jgi:SAM-dependent methyltransferase|nr:class I SAM-dependent methyltransferase [Pelagibacteraceae bacterium]|tara:strand:+ start:81 stop:767 length:687 start_codon:yes stop_codon:yes gene_type:complete
MKYPGAELDNFDKAVIWRKYIFLQIKKFIKGDVLEVGAGIGSFTNNYKNMPNQITLSEVDQQNLLIIKDRFKNTNFIYTSEITKNIEKKFDSIMYLNVLEHIKDDNKEILEAFEKLNDNGYLIILVPAHNKLYSKFDKAIGHFRRYEMDFFEKIEINKSRLIKLCYLDSTGYFLYYLNKIFFKEEVYPSKLKIFIWDKFFTPITYFLDKILFYKFGKNILYVIQKSRT